MKEELSDKLEVWKDDAERRRAELLRSIDEGLVAEPVTGTIFTIAVLKGLLISTAISVGTSLLTRALTPRQKFTTGQLQGTLQVPQSDQGIPIVEGYGGDPAYGALPFRASHAYALEDRVVAGGYFYVVTTAGTSDASAPTFPTTKGASVVSGGATFTNYGRTGGGFRLPMLVVWTSGIRKHVTKTTSGGGGKGGPKAPEQTEITYDLDLAVMPGRGPLHVKRIRANTETIYQNYLAPATSYEAEAGSNTLTNASVITTSYASGGQTVQMEISTGAVQFPNVTGAGSSTQIGIGYVASGTRTCQIWVNGSLVTTVTLPGNDSSLRWHVATVNIPETASNTVKLVNTSSAGGALLYLDRISVGGVSTPTGVPDTFVPTDDPYDPLEPPDPNDPYDRPRTRYAGLLSEDGDGVKAGTLKAGSYSGIAIYPGNNTQLPDPTMQAAIDALYGADSTPAFRHRCLLVLANFFLTNYGGAIPLIQTLADHQTIHTFEAFGAHMCDRTGVLLSTDYDFSGARRLFLRGFPVTPPYNPADVMEELARVYNLYFVESDKIYAFVRNSQADVASLTSKDVGWVDGDAEEDEGELPALDFDLATETEVARRYELTFVDPERDFEQNSQGTSRQITSSEKTERIELALTLYPEEAREVTQRELYEEHVESTKHRLDLSWEFLWLQPGDTFSVVEDDGTTSTIFIESFRPNVGVCPVEGFAEESAVYVQPVSTSGGGVFEIPPVPIPGMSLVGFIDGPPLRDTDRGRLGFYAYAYKRRGDGDWPGSALYVNRGLGYRIISGATFDTEATAGVTASVLTGTTSTTTFVADAVTIDLHHPDDTLESFTQADLLNGAGACMIGGEACQYLTATREPDTATYPNRWYVTVGLRGRRGTASEVGSHASGERFVLIDAAVKFVTVGIEEVGQTRSYRMVTSGQSLDDAAEVEFTFTGLKLKYAEPIDLRLTRLDGTAQAPLLSEWGLPPGAEESGDERYVWRAWNGGSLLRAHIIQGDYSEPLQALPYVSGNPGEDFSLLTIGEEGSLEMAANTGGFAVVVASQRIIGDSRISWRLDARNPPTFVQIEGAGGYAFDINTATDEVIVTDHYFEAGDQFLPASGIPNTSFYYVVNPTGDRFQLAATPGGAPLDLSAYTAGEFKYPGGGFATVWGVSSGGAYYVRPGSATDFQVPAVAGAKYAIEIKSGVTYFFLIDQDIPRYVSRTVPIRWPYTVRIMLGALGGGAQAAIGMTIRHTNPRSFLYTRGMQENDSAPTPVRVTVSRLSLVGEGLAAEATG